MGNLVRTVDNAINVKVHVSDDHGMAQVEIGSGSDAVTFEGALNDIHRLFVEVDTQVSKLIARRKRTLQANGSTDGQSDRRTFRKRAEPIHQSF